MSTFSLTANHFPEKVDGKQYVSVYCLVKGVIQFSRTNSNSKRGKQPRDDESGKQLVEHIRHVGAGYCFIHNDSIDADIMMQNVLVIRFLVDELYGRNVVAELYDIVHGYCLIEIALSNTQPRETLGTLHGQVQCLLRELKTENENGGDAVHTKYLVASIRYAVLDVFGGVIPANPGSYERETLLEWLMPIAKRIIEEKELPQ